MHQAESVHLLIFDVSNRIIDFFDALMFTKHPYRATWEKVIICISAECKSEAMAAPSTQLFMIMFITLNQYDPIWYNPINTAVFRGI